jgi:aminoglycoside/choline kinase family phosphotransferase
VRVPTLVADDGEGTHLVEDLGRVDLAGRFDECPAERERWLERAAEVAGAIARLPDRAINSPFDGGFLFRELELAREAVFDLYFGEPLSPADRDTHDRWARSLVTEILGHPFVLCHRDFHANNLFALDDAETIGVIDFQDLRRGPDAYDLASLLWERSTLGWMSEETAAAVLRRYAERTGTDPDGLSRRLRRVLLQRAWKVCGTFARAVCQGRGEAYRRYLPAEISLVLRSLSSSGEDRLFGEVLRSRARPLLS